MSILLMDAKLLSPINILCFSSSSLIEGSLPMYSYSFIFMKLIKFLKIYFFVKIQNIYNIEIMIKKQVDIK